MAKKRKKDPRVGTGKKPKGSGRRLYTDENPRDTVPIKFATPADARRTVAKVKKVNNPGSKLQTAVTGKVKPGSKAAKRRKSFCARSAGQMKKFPKAAKDPNSRLRQARRRWKC
jgi:hypothetical protein